MAEQPTMKDSGVQARLDKTIDTYIGREIESILIKETSQLMFATRVIPAKDTDEVKHPELVESRIRADVPGTHETQSGYRINGDYYSRAEELEADISQYLIERGLRRG